MIWTPSDIDKLRSAYSIWPPDLNALSLSIGRSKASIKMKAAQLGLTKENTLKDEEKEYIVNNVATSSIARVARDLKRSQTTILKFVRENNVQVKLGSHNKWVPTESELEMIKTSSWSMMKELSEKIGRSIPLIRRQMRLMGIVKPIVIKIPKVKKIRIPKVYTPKPPRVKVERKPRVQRVKPEIQVPRNLSGENRIREAMERISLIKSHENTNKPNQITL